MNDIIIWFIILCVFLIIMGLYISEFTPLDLTQKEKILNMNNITENFSSTENFSPSTSSTNNQTTGASQYYKWGLPKEHINCGHTCDHKCPSICPQKCPPPVVKVNDECTPAPKDVNLNEVCAKCDITLNNNIDKYVLKSSVPACPDMSEFVTKNMMNANPDLSEYILKSEIKPCEKIDITNYILKSEIPACPTCPICPECPICPVCPAIPAQKECKKIYEYNITQHPDIDNYISKTDLDKYYIKKSDILKSNIVKDYLKNNCSNINIPISQPQPISKNAPTTTNTSVQSNANNLSSSSSNKNITSNTTIYSENKNSELLGNDIKGYYAGDSLFAMV